MIFRHFIIASVLASIFCTTISAEESDQAAKGRHWGIYAGIDIPYQLKHIDGLKNRFTLDISIGGSYQYNFNRHWGLNIDLEFNYGRDFSKFDWNYIDSFEADPSVNYYIPMAIKRDNLAVTLPAMVTFSVPLNNFLNIKFGTGPFLKYDIGFNKSHFSENPRMEYNSWWKENRLNFGLGSEVALETGKHLSYFFSIKSIFCKTLDLPLDNSSIFVPSIPHVDINNNVLYHPKYKFQKPNISIGVKYTF